MQNSQLMRKTLEGINIRRNEVIPVEATKKTKDLGKIVIADFKWTEQSN